MIPRRKTFLHAAYMILLAVCLVSPAFALAADKALDTAAIERLTGSKGEFNEKEGVFTVRAPAPILMCASPGCTSHPRSASPPGPRFNKRGTIPWSWVIWSSSKTRSLP